MFNTSKHSSERSNRQTQQRRETSHSQRGPNTHRSRSNHSSRSRSNHSSPSSARRSDNRPQWKAPVKEKLALPSCKTQLQHRCFDSSLETKVNGMFQGSWMDAVLQISLKNLQFMMTKTQNYLTFISKSVNRDQGLPVQWMEKYNRAKEIAERIQKLQKLENEITEKSNVMKTEAAKNYKNIKALHSLYERKKKSENRQPEKRQQTMRGNYEKDMKFVSSGRNEHSNQYIGQLKSSHRPTNQNQSAVNIRNSSQRMASQALQRPNLSLNQYRQEAPTLSSEIDSRRPIIRSATFRPKTRDFKSDIHRFEPLSHAPKRLAPSYNYDEYTTPSKRATNNYPIRREQNLDTSNTSSGGSSLRLNDSRFNTHAKSMGSTKYSNRHENISRPKFQ